MLSASLGDLIYVEGREVREVIMREKPFAILHAKKNTLLKYSGYNANKLRVVGFKTKIKENLFY
jgi:hypothetical protein